MIMLLFVLALEGLHDHVPTVIEGEVAVVKAKDVFFVIAFVGAAVRVIAEDETFVEQLLLRDIFFVAAIQQFFQDAAVGFENGDDAADLFGFMFAAVVVKGVLAAVVAELFVVVATDRTVAIQAVWSGRIGCCHL